MPLPSPPAFLAIIGGVMVIPITTSGEGGGVIIGAITISMEEDNYFAVENEPTNIILLQIRERRKAQ